MGAQGSGVWAAHRRGIWVNAELSSDWGLKVGFTPASMCRDESGGVNGNLHLFASGRCEGALVKYVCWRCTSWIAKYQALMWNGLLKSPVTGAGHCILIPVLVPEVSAFQALFFPGSIRHELSPALVIAGCLPARGFVPKSLGWHTVIGCFLISFLSLNRTSNAAALPQGYNYISHRNVLQWPVKWLCFCQ